VISLKTLIETANFADKPWLMLGAGQTLDERGNFDFQKFNLISLNDAVKTAKVEIAYVKDTDVLERCERALMDNCNWVVMPSHQYENGKLAKDSLLAKRLDHPVLVELERRNKLVVHEFQPLESVDARYRAYSNIVLAPEYFTSEAALTLLAELHAQSVYSLGVDGGKKYAREFQNLQAARFGRPPFDHQLDRLLQVSTKFGLVYRPLIEPMRVFIGSQYEQAIATKVLRYTIHKHASAPVVVQEMDGLPIPVPKDEANRQRTGFSFSRFEIPKLTGYRGRALYVDADMQVFADIAELWRIPFGHQKVLCTSQERPPVWKDNSWFQPGRQFSVMLLDCDRLRHWDMHQFVKELDAGKYTYANLLFDCCAVKPGEIEDRIPQQWNALEHYEEGETKLLHYTVVPTQPWRAWNPLEHVWFKDFKQSIEDGWLTYADVEPLVTAGEARPIMLTYFPEQVQQAAAEPVAGRVKQLQLAAT